MAGEDESSSRGIPSNSIQELGALVSRRGNFGNDGLMDGVGRASAKIRACYQRTFFDLIESLFLRNYGHCALSDCGWDDLASIVIPSKA